MSKASIEWEWEALSAAAFEAYQAGRQDQAVHLWTRAKDLSNAMPDDDPRRATSTNNCAIALLIAGQPDEAVSALAAAVGMWDQTAGWIETMDVQQIARSSLFHLRMEERHKESFKTVRRARWLETLGGARALTTFNNAIGLLFLDRDKEADQLLGDASALREKSCGPNNPELGGIVRIIAGRCESNGQDDRATELNAKYEGMSNEEFRNPLEIWRQEQSTDLGDARRLLAAIQLTAMLHERDFM